MSGDQVPVELRRLWRISSEGRLGRSPELDVERVVAQAVALADREGLAGVSLPKVAKALGFTTMSLYRHVGSKDELLALMADAAFADFGCRAVEDWRAGLREWARGQRELYVRRPWLVRIPLSGPPAGPHQIAFLDRGLGMLRGTGLDWGQKLGVLMLLIGWARYFTQLSLDTAEAREGTGRDQAEVERDYGRALAGLVDARRFADMAELLASGVFEADAADGEVVGQADFGFGVERILDSVAVMLVP